MRDLPGYKILALLLGPKYSVNYVNWLAMEDRPKTKLPQQQYILKQVPRYDGSYDMQSAKLLIKFYMKLYGVN